MRFYDIEQIETVVKNQTLDEIARAELLALMIRMNVLYMIKCAGSGHIGSSFSSLDIVLWLHLHVLAENDIYFSSKGHDVPALYAILIALNKLPFEKLHELRKLNGLPGHPDIHTPNIITNTGSLGMGISKAKGFVKADRLRGVNRQVYVLTGDGELQEGQFWESLVSAANGNYHEITVIIDHNKIQSDKWVSEVSDLGDLEAKLTSFGWQVYRCDGHDFKALDITIKKSQNVLKPTVIIADTIKGQGVGFMTATHYKELEDELYSFHSGAPNNKLYLQAVTELETKISSYDLNLTLTEVPMPTGKPQQQPQKLISAYAKALVAQGDKNPDLVVLDADLMLDCGLIPFRDKYPQRFVECGIAEQDMVSQAGAMALAGLLPVVHSFACFLTTRANEQMYNNLTEHSKVMYVGSLAGLLPSGPGHSHQSVRDIALMSSLPGLILFEPCCENEVELALNCLSQISQSCYIRLCSIPYEVNFKLPDDYQLHIGRGVFVRDGVDAAIITYGPVLLTQAIKAAEQLNRDQDLDIAVINMPWLNQFDKDWLSSICTKYNTIFVFDNHYEEGGLGGQLKSEVCSLHESTRVFTKGIREVPACGQNDEVLAYHQLDAQGIHELIAHELMVEPVC
jgi:transketolase